MDENAEEQGRLTSINDQGSGAFGQDDFETVIRPSNEVAAAAETATSTERACMPAMYLCTYMPRSTEHAW